MQSLQVLRLASRYIAGTGNRARDLAFGCGGMCVAGCRCEYGAGHAGRIALVWHAQQAVLPLPTPRVGCEHPFVAEGGWCYFSRWALPLVKLLTFRMGAARAFCTSPGRRRLGHQKPRARRFDIRARPCCTSRPCTNPTAGSFTLQTPCRGPGRSGGEVRNTYLPECRSMPPMPCL